jgi:hypothetical protein
LNEKKNVHCIGKRKDNNGSWGMEEDWLSFIITNVMMERRRNNRCQVVQPPEPVPSVPNDDAIPLITSSSSSSSPSSLGSTARTLIFFDHSNDEDIKQAQAIQTQTQTQTQTPTVEEAMSSKKRKLLPDEYEHQIKHLETEIRRLKKRVEKRERRAGQYLELYNRSRENWCQYIASLNYQCALHCSPDIFPSCTMLVTNCCHQNICAECRLGDLKKRAFDKCYDTKGQVISELRVDSTSSIEPTSFFTHPQLECPFCRWKNYTCSVQTDLYNASRNELQETLGQIACHQMSAVCTTGMELSFREEDAFDPPYEFELICNCEPSRRPTTGMENHWLVCKAESESKYTVDCPLDHHHDKVCKINLAKCITKSFEEILFDHFKHCTGKILCSGCYQRHNAPIYFNYRDALSHLHVHRSLVQIYEQQKQIGCIENMMFDTNLLHETPRTATLYSFWGLIQWLISFNITLGNFGMSFLAYNMVQIISTTDLGELQRNPERADIAVLLLPKIKSFYMKFMSLMKETEERTQGDKTSLLQYSFRHFLESTVYLVWGGP